MNRRYVITVDGKTHQVDLISRTPNGLVFSTGGETHQVSIATLLDVSQQRATVSASHARTETSPTPQSAPDGAIVSPMPGIVGKILCAVGEQVKRGTPLVVIEAMKMENNISANCDGKISEILIGVGEEVKKGQALLQIK